MLKTPMKKRQEKPSENLPEEMPILLVYLDNPMTGAVKFKPKVKGRWKKARSVYDAAHQADAVMPTPRVIEYVDRMR